MAGNPFPGLTGYGFQDRLLFSGRQAEVDNLSSRILTHRLTIITAPSGTGKTSLLHAGIVPQLLVNDGLPIMCRPGPVHPREEVRQALIAAVMPDKTMDDQLVAKLKEHKVEASTPVDDVLNLVNALPPQEQMALLYPTRPTQDDHREHAVRGGYLTRLLRGSLPVRWLPLFADALLGASEPQFQRPATWGEAVKLATSREIVEAAASWRRRLGKLSIANAFKDVLERTEAFPFPLVLTLVIDQFEEVFTLYQSLPRAAEGDPDRPGRTLLIERRQSAVQDLFSDLRKLLLLDAPDIRVVLSLRHEHFVELQNALSHALRGASEYEVAVNTWHLGPLRKERVVTMLEDSGTIRRERAQKLADDLADADGTIRPPLLSVVGRLAWEQAQHGEENPRTAGQLLDDEVARLFAQGWDGHSIGGSPVAGEVLQDEALDLLERLFTADGRRNIAAKSSLLDLDLRNVELRELALHLLHRGKQLVRIEARGATAFVEIIHEFLVFLLRRHLEHDAVTARRRRRRFQTLLSTLRSNDDDALADVLLDDLRDNRARIGWTAETAARTAWRLLATTGWAKRVNRGEGATSRAE
jgi:hypothetical protein